MKYKDNRFVKHQDKQRNGEFDYYHNKSERTLKRERERKHILFFNKNLLHRKVEKDWWNSLSDGDKDSVSQSYYSQEMMSDLKNDEFLWFNEKHFDTWKEWVDHIYSEYKPNIIKYRELKLKKLGI